MRNHWILTKVFSCLLSTTCCLLPTVVTAQITFERTYGGAVNDNGLSVQQTSDGGYIITGSTNSFGAGSSDVYLIKTNSSGDTLWTRTFGGTSDDGGYSVQETSVGGYVIAGFTYSFGAGSSDVYLIKTNAGGDTLWARTFGGTSNDWGTSVQETSDGGYIIAGSTYSFGAGFNDIYLIKTTSSGDTLWTRAFGGTSYEGGSSVQQTIPDGGYIIAGVTNSFGAGFYDAYLIKTNAGGDTLWTKTFGGTSDDDGYSVQETTDGGYILSGSTYSFGEGMDDVYLIKTNAGGDTLWTKTFGGASWETGSCLQQTSDGGYIISGLTWSFGAGLGDAYLIKTNSGGDSLWTKTFGGTLDDYGYSVQQTSDGGFIITGYTNSFGAGASDVYLIKTDSLGNVIVGVEEGEDLRLKIEDWRLELLQNQPNPFHHSTVIRYTLPAIGDKHSAVSKRGNILVRLVVYDISGQLIETLVNESQEPGVYQLPMTSYQLPGSGIYFYRLQISQPPFHKGGKGDFTQTRKMVLLK